MYVPWNLSWWEVSCRTEASDTLSMPQSIEYGVLFVWHVVVMLHLFVWGQSDKRKNRASWDKRIPGKKMGQGIKWAKRTSKLTGAKRDWLGPSRTNQKWIHIIIMLTPPRVPMFAIFDATIQAKLSTKKIVQFFRSLAQRYRRYRPNTLCVDYGHPTMF